VRKHIDKLDNIGVLEFLQIFDFANRCQIKPILELANFDLFNGDFATGGDLRPCFLHALA
jgi:hypothetical protein